MNTRPWIGVVIGAVCIVVLISGIGYAIYWLDAREEAREYAGGIDVETAQEEAVEALANQREDALELMPMSHSRGYALGRETWVFMYNNSSSFEQICVYVWSPNNGYDLRSIVGKCNS